MTQEIKDMTKNTTTNLTQGNNCQKLLYKWKCATIPNIVMEI